jgi:hypothetical protein
MVFAPFWRWWLSFEKTLIEIFKMLHEPAPILYLHRARQPLSALFHMLVHREAGDVDIKDLKYGKKRMVYPEVS